MRFSLKPFLSDAFLPVDYTKTTENLMKTEVSENSFKWRLLENASFLKRVCM